MSLPDYFFKLPKTLSELIRTDEYDIYIGGKLGNDLFINDPDRANRLYEYAENGCDGSTYAEVLEDEQEFFDMYYSEQEKELDSVIENHFIEYEEEHSSGLSEEDKNNKLIEIENTIRANFEKIKLSIQTEIDDCIQWHIVNGTYEEIIG